MKKLSVPMDFIVFDSGYESGILCEEPLRTTLIEGLTPRRGPQGARPVCVLGIEPSFFDGEPSPGDRALSDAWIEALHHRPRNFPTDGICFRACPPRTSLELGDIGSTYMQLKSMHYCRMHAISDVSLWELESLDLRFGLVRIDAEAS